MAMPKPSPALVDALHDAVPEQARVHRRKMFGCPALFASSTGQMFGGVYAECLNVRLPSADLEQVFAAGGHPFDPMGGRPMREYACLPASWIEDPPQLRAWLERALAFAEGLPPKRK